MTLIVNEWIVTTLEVVKAFFSLYMLPRNFRELTSACTPFPTFLGYFLSHAFSVGSNLFNQVIFSKTTFDKYDLHL